MTKSQFIAKKDKMMLSETRQSGTKKIIASITAILASFIVAILITCLIENNWSLFLSIPATIFTSPFESFASINMLFCNMAILIVASMAFIIPFKTGLFNMGVSGQMLAGATVATVFAHLVPNMPNGLGQITVLLISSVIGGLIGAVVGAMKAYLNVNEVVSTIMLNWIIYFLSVYFLKMLPGQSGDFTTTVGSNYSLELASGFAWIPLVIIAFIMVIFVFIFLKFSVSGKKMIAVGMSHTGAESAGYNIPLNIIGSLAISGVMAGILGIICYLGNTNQMPLTIVSKTIPIEGFNGISVGLISMCVPIAAIPVSFLFAMIQASTGQLQMLNVDQNMPNIIFGIVVYGAAIITLFLSFKPWKLIIELFTSKQHYAKITKKNKAICEFNHKLNDDITSLEKFYNSEINFIKSKVRLDYPLKQKLMTKIYYIKFKFYKAIMLAKNKPESKNQKSYIRYNDCLAMACGESSRIALISENKNNLFAHRNNRYKFYKFGINKITSKSDLKLLKQAFYNGYNQYRKQIIDHYKTSTNELNIEQVINRYEEAVISEVDLLSKEKSIDISRTKPFKQVFERKQVKINGNVTVFSNYYEKETHRIIAEGKKK